MLSALPWLYPDAIFVSFRPHTSYTLEVYPCHAHPANISVESGMLTKCAHSLRFPVELTSHLLHASAYRAQPFLPYTLALHTLRSTVKLINHTHM